MSSAMEEEEADLRDDLRGRPFERITLVEDGVRWMGVVEDLAGLTEEEEVGKGTEGGSTCEWDGGRSGRKWGGE
jgi:hypothetical protein